MPIQLNTHTEKLDGHGFINRTTVTNMVKDYRANRKDKNTLNFAHFSVAEVVELLVDNGIIVGLPDQDFTPYGVKVYMANHGVDPDTCPAGRAEDYKNRDTVIICNTKLQGDTWTDMLDDNQWVSFAGAGTDKGVDKGGICPPDCPGVGPNGEPNSEDVAVKPVP